MAPMTTTKSDEDRTTAAAGVDLTALAVGVMGAVTGPRGPAPAVERVADALARRAAGATYAEIAAAVGISAKRAASWCRAAARIDGRFDARGAKPRRTRASTRRPATRMLSARVETELVELLARRAESEGRSVTAMVEAALRSFVGRKVAGVETAVRRELRKRLKEELRDLAAAVGAHDAELSRQGNNLNQLAAFCNRYRELPVTIVDELAATRRALEENRAATERLHAAVLARFDDGEG
ncbi:hypothetical protein A5777_16495 [Gordonia sp. 852002-10350_SCH5691597]|nr:hypothetical protein A5777_16495 [Gordonia sp. 852002-10350_SCH5691597]